MTTFSPRELIETFIRNYASLFPRPFFFFFFLSFPFFSFFLDTLPTTFQPLLFQSRPRPACISRFVKLCATQTRRLWNNGRHVDAGYSILRLNYFLYFTATSTDPVMSVHRWVAAWGALRCPILLPRCRKARRSGDLSWLAWAFLPVLQLSCNNHIALLFPISTDYTVSVTRCSFAPSEESRYSFRLNNCLQPRRS